MNTNTTTTARQFNILIAACVVAQEVLETAEWVADLGGRAPYFEEAEKCHLKSFATLQAAIEVAPWGQSGSVFITDQRADWNSTRCRTLHINGRPVATLMLRWQQAPECRLVEYDPEFSAKRAAEKVAAREAHEAYLAARQELVEALRVYDHAQAASFGRWEYHDGQMGGYFTHLDREGVGIAAYSALRTAWGEGWEDIVPQRSFEREAEHWERKLSCSPRW